LFLSEQWTGDDDADYESPQERERYAQRRKDAGVPADVEHQSKPDIAPNLIERAVAAFDRLYYFQIWMVSIVTFPGSVSKGPKSELATALSPIASVFS
jgi:hypothetical protein